MVRGVDDEGGIGPDCLRKFLPHGGPGGATLWVGNLGVDSSDTEKLEGVHVSFMRQVMRMNSLMLGGKTWIKEEAGRVLQESGTKPLQEYINRRQAMVAECVAILPIFKVCAKDMVYEVGGRLCEQ